jgi:hypothetical protein
VFDGYLLISLHEKRGGVWAEFDPATGATLTTFAVRPTLNSLFYIAITIFDTHWSVIINSTNQQCG